MNLLSMDFFTKVVLLNAVTFTCHAVCLFLLSDKKDGRLVSAVRMAAIWVVAMALCVFATMRHWFDFYWFITIFVSFAMMIVFSLDSTGCRAKKIFVSSAYVTYFYVTMIPCELCLQFLPRPWNYLPYPLVRVAMYVLLMVFWQRRGRAVFESATGNITDSRWRLLAAFSVTSLFCVSVVMIRLLMVNRDDNLWDFVISSCVLLAVASAYVLVIRIMNLLNQENEHLVMRVEDWLLKAELDAEKQYVSQAKQYRHDLRHQNQLLLSFAESGDVEKIKRHLREYDEALDASALHAFCPNSVANALLKNFARNADAAGVQCEIHANIPESLPLTDIEICSLFGNLLENALEACRKCPNPHFSLKAEVSDDVLRIETRNSVAGTVRFKDELPVTTRKVGGGTGTKSIQHTVEQHGGLAEFAQSGGDFVVKIILPIQVNGGGAVRRRWFRLKR